MEKVYLTAFGQKLPGIVVSAPTPTTVTTARGRTFQSERVQVITQRPTNPDNGPVRLILRKSPEDTGFLWPREKNFVGLDVDENGALLSLEEVSELAMAFTLEQQALRLASQTPDEVPFETA